MTLNIISPSQASTAGQCPRKWVFKYILGEKEPENQYTAGGRAAHKRLEEYYKTGVLPASDVPGRVALAALQLMPTFDRGLCPEEPIFEVPFAGGIFGRRDDEERMCRMDLYDPRDPQNPALYDLKTTGDLRYIKDVATLKADIQVNVYCKEIMRRTGADHVKCHWVYVTRADKPKAKRVDFEIRAADVAATEAAWQETIADIQRMFETRPKVNEVEPNLAHCGEFRGGCYYGPRQKDLCPLTQSERMIAAMMNGTPDKDTKAAVNDFLNQSGFGAPPAVATNLAPPTFSIPAPAPPPAPVFDPRTFPLPVQQDGNPIPEAQRVAFLAFCLDDLTNRNPLFHLNAIPTPEFVAAARLLVSPPAPAPAPVPVVAAPPAPVPVAAPPQLTLPPLPTPDAPPVRRGRPPGSKNKGSAPASEVPAAPEGTKVIQIVVTDAVLDRILALLNVDTDRV